MFESLSGKLQATFKRLRNKGRITERDVDEALREVRVALLEADVNFKVVKDFIGAVRTKAVGQDVLGTLTGPQTVVKLVHDEMVAMLGGAEPRLMVASKPPTVILLEGLQGAGKTTAAAKLAMQLKKSGHRPYLVAADRQRPAAIEQLRVLGEQISVPVHLGQSGQDARTVAREALDRAQLGDYDALLVDTAGRLQIDEGLMRELQEVSAAVHPHETLLVVDAMTGQQAVAVAEAFGTRTHVTGAILTKLDGDTRGGAALSLRASTGVPIKYIGVGERVDALETFHPDRIASRILGMGDVMTLIERAQALDQTQVADLGRKLKRGEFTMEDFLSQLQQVKRMGPIGDLLKMIPGLSGRQLPEVDEGSLKRVEAIIQSMTRQERQRPEIIDGSRRRRIARGSGTHVQDVNRLLKQFSDLKRLMKGIGGRGKHMSMPKWP